MREVSSEIGSVEQTWAATVVFEMTKMSGHELWAVLVMIVLVELDPPALREVVLTA